MNAINEGVYVKYIKRLMDFILSLTAIIILSPLFIFLSIIVRVFLGPGVIFKQNRPGKNERIFTMYKFRTMNNKKDEFGNLFADKDRLSKLGMFLRSSSLDELPELYNILIGNMSIVGPRPQLVKDMIFMSKEQRQRHLILPGLTGHAQVNGRNNISWEKKISLDIEYLNKVGFIMDIKIIILTFMKVFIRKNVNTLNMATAEDLGDYLLRTERISLNEYDEILKRSYKHS